MQYAIYEANNPLALHAICSSLASARYWIDVLAPSYCKRGFFMDKTLTPDSFVIREYK